MPSARAPQVEPTLYRKHRPQVFADVVGQEHVLRVLRRAITEHRLTHAYLFAGPRGTGKTTTARLLAKRLNCEKPKSAEPCGACASCTAVQDGMHLDLIEIDAASNRSIDDIRSLKERIGLQPAHGHWKVYIVDEVHMLTKEAFNALLKTLEEPPSHALFILATTELEKVPDTVRSRCQTFVFRRAPVALVIERLRKVARAERFKLTPEALHLLATASGGCFRDAESLLAMVAGTSGTTITDEDVSALLGLTPLATAQRFVGALVERDARGALAVLEDVVTRGASVAFFTETLARYLRALASTSAAGVHAESFSPDEHHRFQEHLAASSTPELVALLRLVLRAKTELRDAVYEELPLELVALEWCGSEAADNRQQATGDRSVERPAPDGSRGGVARPSGHGSPPTAGGARERAAAQRASLGRASGGQSPTGAQGRESASKLSLDRILSIWPAFLRAASSLHALLGPMLRDAVPVAVRDDTLFVLSNHALAHDRLRDATFRHPLEERLQQTCGEKLQLRLVRARDLSAHDLPEPSQEARARLDAALREDATASGVTDASLSDALALFGGEVVDKGSAAP